MKDYPLSDLIDIRSHFDPEPLRNSRIFITGAGSWFGTWITSFLDYANINYERWLKPYDRFPTGAFDYVIHLAQCPIQPILRWSFHNALVKTFLFASSGSVNNPDPDAKSNKRHDEMAVCKSGLDYRIARIYSVIGPGSPLRYAPAKFIHQALKHEPLTVTNLGTSVRTYLYVTDLVAWLLTIMVHGESKIFDVAGYKPITTLDLARRVNKITGNPGLSIMDMWNNDIRPVYCPDTMNYNNSRKLGLDVWTGIDEAIRKTWEYYK
jgi:nucleoside-diphosphate-sugar epimerase